MSLLSIFATAILPIIAIAAVGFALGRMRDIAVEPLKTVSVAVLTTTLASVPVPTVLIAALQSTFVGSLL